MRKTLMATVVSLTVLWLGSSLFAGWVVLPPMLLHAPMPDRTEAQREEIRRHLATAGSHWDVTELKGGRGCLLEVWRLHRLHPKGVAIFLHGFGDDMWGTIGRAADLPDWDAVGFTFRGRDRQPRIPCTLGGWERFDIAAVVHQLEEQGVPRSRMVFAAWSQGAGVALLALSNLEKDAGPLGGALLESPFENIGEAAKNHIKLALGRWEFLARLAEWLALRRAGELAAFDPSQVSPRNAAQGLRTPIALVTGDADRDTPIEGVRAIAESHPDLTVVHGAGHCQASGQLPGGWRRWAESRLQWWGF
jgi:pimeloyl-ACP methyl ester carboxylesterase